MLKELGFIKTAERSVLQRAKDIAIVGGASALSKTIIPGPWEGAVAAKYAPKGKKRKAALETTVVSSIGAIPGTVTLAKSLKGDSIKWRDMPKARFKQFTNFIKNPGRTKNFVEALKKTKGLGGKVLGTLAAGGAIGGMAGFAHATKGEQDGTT